MNLNNTQYENINPNTFEIKTKNFLIQQNIYHSGYGDYKLCPIMNPIEFCYKASCNPGTIDTVCIVSVLNKHSIDIADSLSEHGLNTLSTTKPIPVIMFPVGKQFMGKFEVREGIYDENIILRTNFAYVIKKQNDIFPINKNGSVVYTNPITTIRDSNYEPYDNDTIFKTAIISVSPEISTDLLNDNGKQLLKSKDLLKLQIDIEGVFQTALCGCHNVLILSHLPEEFNIPIDDQILIYNNCIMKYGHKFKSIIISIPPYENTQIFNYFAQHIIIPDKLSENNNIITSSDSKENIKQKMTGMNEKERMEILKKMIRQKRKLNKQQQD
jgi:hypothetical protein